MIGIISWIVMGMIGGWVVGQSMGGGRKNLLGDVVMGTASAVLSGFLFSSLVGIADAINSFNFISIIVAFFGAAIIVGTTRTLIARRQVA